MDSQAPNQAVGEWLPSGELIENISFVKSEYTYKNSRFDFYVEAFGAYPGEVRKIFIEVKGATLEENGAVRFPDAPSERAVKHLRELEEAVNEGYEAYVLFVVQMKGAEYLIPNRAAQPMFAEELLKASKSGVRIAAYDCEVTEDSMRIRRELPVLLTEEAAREREALRILSQVPAPLLSWYKENKRELPWREEQNPYHIWVSEIMLQQTRVEAVKPYYQRFLRELPTVEALAEAAEETLLKLWEGLGYYNRVRNMQMAARQIMLEYGGEFPDTYEEILSLKGIGSYTAGAVSSFAFGRQRAAADGNVLRVLSRLLADDRDITKQSVRKGMEKWIESVIPQDGAGDFNQGLIELGALICAPNKMPRCGECPLAGLCAAHKDKRELDYPTRKKTKARKIEERTVFLFREGEKTAIRKRPSRGLLAGLYEFPNIKGTLTREEAFAYSKEMGFSPIRILPLGGAKHIFSHVEWRMNGYMIQIDELKEGGTKAGKDLFFVSLEDLQKTYAVPAAFSAFSSYLRLSAPVV